MWNIKFLVQELFKSQSSQDFVNRRFKSDNKIILDVDGEIEYVVTKKESTFYMSKDINNVNSVYCDYIFNDIRKEDIVIDIGANIGGFTIPASKMAARVFAIEPITTDELIKNVSLNECKNIEIISGALGNGNILKIQWGNRSKIVNTMTLQDIKNICGGCDFLKVDCEGGEWAITPDELVDIRRIECEVHKIGKPFLEMENLLRASGFDYKVDTRRGYTGLWIIHAKNRSLK